MAQERLATGIMTATEEGAVLLRERLHLELPAKAARRKRVGDLNDQRGDRQQDTHVLKRDLQRPEFGIVQNPLEQVERCASQVTLEQLEERALGGITDYGEDQTQAKSGLLRKISG